MFLTGLYDMKPEEQLTCTPCKDYTHMLQLQGHRNCSAISPCKKMQLQFYYCNTQVSAGTYVSKLRQGIWEAMEMKLWTYLGYMGRSIGGLTVLCGRKGKQMTDNSEERSNLGDRLLIMSCSLCILLLLMIFLLMICPVLMVLVLQMLLTNCVRHCRT